MITKPLDIHSKVDDGDMFFVAHTFTGVATGTSVYLRQKVGTLKHLHAILNMITTGEWEFTSYSGTTYTAPGTAVTPVNRRSDSTKIIDSTFFHTPTINVLGTERLSYRFGSGTNPAQSSTALFSENLESIFEPGIDILVKLTNNSGATQYISTILNVYEETAPA